MRVVKIIGAALACAVAGAAAAGPVALSPANPQPDAAALAPGLNVRYAFPPEVKSLDDADYWLKEKSEPGEPLVGLDYPDTLEGEPALTSGQATRVAAAISGYIRFERAGAHKVEFLSNDGLRVTIGGREISSYDGRHPCESDGFYEVTVPEPGWYELEMVYFQRLSSSCLLMKWDGGDGGFGWTANEAFARGDN